MIYTIGREKGGIVNHCTQIPHLQTRSGSHKRTLLNLPHNLSAEQGSLYARRVSPDLTDRQSIRDRTDQDHERGEPGGKQTCNHNYQQAIKYKSCSSVAGARHRHTQHHHFREW